ncbi:hypothetical protein F4779DRAFT_294008 [Xylariaceae sp. FL0662B]|nr:hypothetical protein F4779DRAFT_294008 [Xylariaceae sp. FL0662B]
MSDSSIPTTGAGAKNKPSYEDLMKAHEDLKLRYGFVLKEKNSVAEAYEDLKKSAEDQFGLADLKKQLSTVEDMRDNAFIKNSQIYSQFLKMRGELKKVKMANEKMVALGQGDDAQKQKEALDKAMAVEAQLRQRTADMKRLQVEKGQLNVKAKELTEAKLQLKLQNQEQEQVIKTAQTYCAQLEEQLQQAQTQSEQANNQLQQLEQQLQQAQAQNEHTNEELQKLEQQLQQTQAQNEHVKNQLEQMHQLQENLQIMNQVHQHQQEQIQQYQQQQQQQEQLQKQQNQYHHYHQYQAQEQPNPQTTPTLTPCRARKLQLARRRLQKMQASQHHAARERERAAELRLKGEFFGAVVSDAERYLGLRLAQLQKKLAKSARAELAETERELYEKVLVQYLAPPEPEEPTMTTNEAVVLSSKQAIEIARAQHERVRKAARRVTRNHRLAEDIERLRVDLEARKQQLLLMKKEEE